MHLKETRHHSILSEHGALIHGKEHRHGELTIDIRFVKSGQVVQAIVHRFAGEATL